VRAVFQFLLQASAPIEASEMIQHVLMHQLEEVEETMQRISVGVASGDITTEYFLLEFLLLTPALAQAIKRRSGEGAAEATLLPRLETLGASTSFRVRKACVAALAMIMGHVSSSAVATLVPHFLKISSDEIWGVRKACAENLPAVAAAVDATTREGIITECAIRLAQDESRWVRCTVFKNLGALVATFVSAPPPIEELRRRAMSETTSAPNTPLQLVAAAIGEVPGSPSAFRSIRSLKIGSMGDMSDSSEADGAPEVITLADASVDDSDTDAKDTDAKDTTDTAINSDSVGDTSEAGHTAGGEPTTAEEEEGEEEGGDNFDASGNMPQFHSKEKTKLNKRRVSPAPWDLARLASFLEAEKTLAEPASDDVFDSPDPDEQEGREVSGAEVLLASDGGEVLGGDDGPDTIAPDHDDGDEVSVSKAASSTDEPADTATVSAETVTSFTYWRIPVGEIDPELLRMLGDVGGDTSASATAAADSPSSQCADSAASPSTPVSAASGVSGSDASADPKLESGDRGFAAPTAIIASIPMQETVPLPVPLELVQYFNMMGDPASSKTIDPDITRSCAFTIPAMVWALGRDHWPLIQETYLKMGASLDWRIRATLARSCHIVAMIVGRDITERDLLQVYVICPAPAGVH
jgi:hypothetical protein